MVDFAMKLKRQSSQKFWLQWVGANVLAEVIGLGFTVFVVVTIFPQTDAGTGTLAVIGATLLLIATGAFEGVCVGTLQWAVLKQRLPAIRLRAWVLPTLIGALVAWTLGMLPSTIMNLAEASSPTGAPVAEPSTVVVYLLAVVMGLGLGAVLGVPQWMTLKQHVPQAGLWILANALAWAVGMPIIFIGIDMIVAMGTSVIVVAVLRTLILTGLAVGSIHGLFLVWLTRQS